MVFSSLSFIFLLFPLALFLDMVARSFKNIYLRNSFLLATSLLFYTWGEAYNVFLLLGLAILNYIGGNNIAKSKNKKFHLISLIFINLGILFYYKYFVWAMSLVLPNVSVTHHTMPLGISFFTFHALSYIIDIYRGQIKPARNALDFLTYFCMFPHLVAGPIVRFAQVQDDIDQRGPSRELFNFGVYRFLVGLNKKVLIANSAAYLADAAFTNSISGVGMLDAWIGILAYAIQIYFDFSGYSDMAIGLAAMIGFRFEENFKRPYSSASIKEFWRRWHISLSSWFRDYVYIPLGGSRGGEWGTYRNLLIVFFLCGLWHGANLTFIIWGLWHGAFLVVERLKPVAALIDRLPIFVMRIYTIIIVLIGWVFFRSNDLGSAIAYLGHMFSFQSMEATLIYYKIPSLLTAIGILIVLIPDRFIPQPTSHKPAAFGFSIYLVQAILFFASLSMLLTNSRNPFIYFNF
ncbi:MBOAT family protein (plasmid) [Bartonella sp. HY329]|uniref:MBOAT family O-acyltransferase n=1 Tax=unclassified Bartonella TaxID=2645622 RepID=UPI0021CA1623|nr:MULTISPECIES: MBOAT family O-acyltransferase [unclassified Bartonella]UXM96567.1 MBOAT family protein [Bartonella sp. HY329]UXN10890.1 MBOAT family protein [Bartonella sp. HY328]